jgi:O-antigen ligase
VNRAESRLVPGMPLWMAGLGMCLGVWLAREQWLYSVVLVACLVLAIWPVEATLGTYAFLLPFDSVTRFGSSPDGRTLTFYLGALTAVVLLGVGLSSQRLKFPPRISKYWLAFVGWGVLTVFWALDEGAVLKELPTVLGLAGLYLVAVCFQISKQQLSRIAFLTVVGGVAASLFSIEKFFAGVSTIEARSSLIAGTQQADPNIFAASLVIPLALAVAEAGSTKNVSRKIMMLLASAIITLAILLTMSRGALLALIVMGAIYAYRLKLKRWAVVWFAVLGAGFCALPSLFFLRLQSALATGGAGRLDIWVAGLSALKHFALQGAGLGNFDVAYGQYAGFAPIFRGYNRAAHNIYLQIAVEFGITGAALLFMAIRGHLREFQCTQALQSNARSNPLVLACETMTAGMLVSAFFVGLLWEKSFWMVWILCAFSIRATRASSAPVAIRA